MYTPPLHHMAKMFVHGPKCPPYVFISVCNQSNVVLWDHHIVPQGAIIGTTTHTYGGELILSRQHDVLKQVKDTMCVHSVSTNCYTLEYFVLCSDGVRIFDFNGKFITLACTSGENSIPMSIAHLPLPDWLVYSCFAVGYTDGTIVVWGKCHQQVIRNSATNENGKGDGEVDNGSSLTLTIPSNDIGMAAERIPSLLWILASQNINIDLISTNGDVEVSSTTDQYVCVPLVKGQALSSNVAKSKSICVVALSQDLKSVIGGDVNGNVIVWNM